MEWSDPRRVKEKNAQPGQELLVYRWLMFGKQSGRFASQNVHNKNYVFAELPATTTLGKVRVLPICLQRQTKAKKNWIFLRNQAHHFVFAFGILLPSPYSVLFSNPCHTLPILEMHKVPSNHVLHTLPGPSWNDLFGGSPTLEKKYVWILHLPQSTLDTYPGPTHNIELNNA